MSRLLFVGSLFALLIAGMVTTAVAMHHNAAPSQPLARLEGTDIWPAGTRPAPAFALHDQNGRLVSRASLRGQVYAITFLDSRCTKACPVEAHALATVRRQLGQHYPFKVVVVSVLPQYDRPATVEAFAHKSGLNGDWHWLLGSKQQLAPVWRAYGIWVVTGILHTAAVYLVDRRGDVRVADAVPFIPSQLAASVRALTAQPVTRQTSVNG